MFKFLKRKSSLTTHSLDSLAEISGFLRHGGGVSSVSRDTAVQVTGVFCAARVIAEGIAQMPVRLLRDDWSGDMVVRSVARDHWAHKLLARRPNEFQTSFEFREYAVLAALLDNAFLGVKNTMADGRVSEILPIPMGGWSLQRNSSTWEYTFRVSYANGSFGEFEPSQVVYLRGPSMDGLTAFPALAAAREAIGLSRSLEKQQARLASNGGKPSGVLSFAQPLGDEAKNKLRKVWEERFSPDGDGGVAILDGDAKFASMAMTSVDAQYMETRKFQIEEIARAFRVHPIMLMHSNASTTFASAEQHFRNHVVHTLGPWMRRFEEVFNRDILMDDVEHRFDLDERALLRGDFADQAEYYTKALGAGGQPGWMTPNEVRQERDMNPSREAWANEVPRGAMGQQEVEADESS